MPKPAQIINSNFSPLTRKKTALSPMWLFCYNQLCWFFFFSFSPLCWHSCGRLNTPLAQGKLLAWAHKEEPRERQAAQVWPQCGLWIAGWLTAGLVLFWERAGCESTAVWLGGFRHWYSVTVTSNSSALEGQNSPQPLVSWTNLMWMKLRGSS